MERRKFTREFKLEAVKLIRDRGVGVGVTQASRDLGVHQTGPPSIRPSLILQTITVRAPKPAASAPLALAGVRRGVYSPTMLMARALGWLSQNRQAASTAEMRPALRPG
jgi:hypothetical protein